MREHYTRKKSKAKKYSIFLGKYLEKAKKYSIFVTDKRR